MTGLFALTSFMLVAQFIKTISGVSIDAEFGKNTLISTTRSFSSNLSQCTAKHNNITYSIYPNLNDTSLRFRGDKGYCAFYIVNTNFDHAGEWTINTRWTDNDNITSDSNFTYAVHVHQTDGLLLPTSNIYGEYGSSAILYFKDTFDDVTKCYIVCNEYGDTTTYMLSDNSNGTVDGLELYGKCGFRMLLNRPWKHSWKLVQESGEYKIKYQYFRINSVNKIIAPEKLRKVWSLGSEQQLSIREHYTEKYCELERPDGRIIPLQSMCTYRIKKVNENHAGTWKIRYVTVSSMNIVEQEIIINVVDSYAINATVTTTKDHMIHMLCNTYASTIDFCLFTMPNGTVINALPGIGNEKYEYFGTGYKSIPGGNFAQCGLTIRKPSYYDYGLWKCTVKIEGTSSETISTFVSTANLTGKTIERSHISTNNVYVKRGDNFWIKCATNKSLDYCWLRSPNNTNYSVRMNRGETTNSLLYVGEGLSLGVCGAFIENADSTHTGDWSCRLGVSGDAEIESIVTVTVEDSYIMPIQKTINVAHDKPKLIVNILPEKEATIKYCRWVHPTGHGFYKENNNHYLRKQNSTSCSLTVTDVSVGDLGTWSCYIRLTGSDEEIRTTIKLVFETQSDSNILINIFIVCLLTLMLIGGIICGFLVYRRRLYLSKKSTSQYNEFDPSKRFSMTMTEKTST